MRTRRRGRGRATGRVRLGARAAVAIGVLLVVVSVLAPAAGANYPRIEATVGCDRVVTWRASASSEGSDEQRTNTRVAVEYRTGADQPWQPAGPVGSFDAAGGFAFDGEVELPDDADSIELRARTLVPWGSDQQGDPAGDERYATAQLPESCARVPLAVRQAEDCAAGAVTVSTTNVGDRTVQAAVSVDRVQVRSITLEPGADAELVVPALPGRPTVVEVGADGVVVSERTHGEDCSPAGPTAVVLERCGAPAGRLVVLATATAEPVPAEILLDGASVDTATVAPGTELRRTLDVPAGELSVEVRLAGRVVATGRTGGCTGPVAGVLGCGTGAQPSCAAAAPPTTAAPVGPPPPLPPGTGGALPHTGPAQRAIGLGLGGLLLAGGGLVLAARDRRRVLPSALGQALAPYRQHWWDEL